MNNLFKAPGAVPQFTMTIKTSGTTQTYTVPTNCRQLLVICVGPGGGGGGGGTGGGTGGNGSTATVFDTMSAGAAGGGSPGGAGPGGIAANGDIGVTGNPGHLISISAVTNIYGLPGGSSIVGGAGVGGSNGGGAGGNASGNSGSGGGGAGGTATVQPGGGGGAGAFVQKLFASPLSATYTYTVGAGGAGGTAGTGGNAGGNGAAGLIIIYEYY